MTHLVKAGVVVCSCRYLGETNKLDAGSVSSFLKSKRPDVPILSVNNLCEEVSRITQFVREQALESIVIAACSDPNCTEQFRRASEEAGIMPLMVEDFSLKEIYAQSADTAQNATRWAKIATYARLEKALRTNLAKNARVKFATRETLSRRAFMRGMRKFFLQYRQTPIALGDICSRYSKTCVHCIDSCGSSAMTTGPKGVQINEESCVECGACAAACPVGALQVPGLSDGEVAAMISGMTADGLDAERRALVVTCHDGVSKLREEWTQEHPPELCFGLTVAPCIASVSWAHLMLSSSLGVGLIAMCPDTSCKKSIALADTKQSFAFMEEILKATGKCGSVCALTEAHKNLSLGKSLSAYARSLPSFSGPETVYKDEKRRELLKAAASRLAMSEGSGLKIRWSNEASLFFDLTVDADRCTLCGACVPQCPDKALKLSDESGSLLFTPSMCVGCGICVKVCPASALRLQRSFSFAAVVEDESVEKVRGEKAYCSKCGAPIHQIRTIEAVTKLLQAKGFSTSLEKQLLCNACKSSELVSATDSPT